MHKCPISTRVCVNPDGTFVPYHPMFMGRGRDGKGHFLQPGADKQLHDVSVEMKTGETISDRSLRGPDLQFHLRQLLFVDLENPKPWQIFVAVETHWRVQQARGIARKNWVLTTGCYLIEHGEEWFRKARERLSAMSQNGYLTFGQFASFSPITCNEKTLRRWLSRQIWTEGTKGGHCRIRLCDDFYWWWTKQFAAGTARQQIKNKKTTMTPEGFQKEGDKIIGVSTRTIEALGHRIRLRTKTAGKTTEEILNDPKKDKIWDRDIDELAPYWFKSYREGCSLLTEADALKLACLIEELRTRKRQQGKSDFVSKSALAKARGISKSTFLRKGYGKICDDLKLIIKASPSQSKKRKETTGNEVPLPEKTLSESMPIESAEERGYTEDQTNDEKTLPQRAADEKVRKLKDDGLDRIKGTFQLRKEEALIECAGCHRLIKTMDPCPFCSAKLGASELDTGRD